MTPTNSRRPGRIRMFIKRHRKRILLGVVVLVILALTTTVAYRAGVKQGSKSIKNKAVMQWPDLYKLKPSAQQKPKDDAQKNTKSTATRNSGFFRLNGVVQNPKKDSFSLKLADGTIVTLAITDKTKYYTGSTRTIQPTSSIKAGATVTVIGTIGATGTFGATTIQSEK